MLFCCVSKSGLHHHAVLTCDLAAMCRPLITERIVNQYQAPVVTPSPRASGSVSSCDEDFERGTLLPKVRQGGGGVICCGCIAGFQDLEGLGQSV